MNIEHITESDRASFFHALSRKKPLSNFEFVFDKTFLPNKPSVKKKFSLFFDSERPYLYGGHDLPETIQSLDEIKIKAQKEKSVLFDLESPYLLNPIHIPKPWGQEIWYTGMEKRGEVTIEGMEGHLDLSFLMALLGTDLLGDYENMVLVKILDPLADEVAGDLYLELHERKEEVYIVSHVDRKAWPNGVGEICFGLNSDLAKTMSDAMVKEKLLFAIKDYEEIRRKIDDALDARQENNEEARESKTAREAELSQLPRVWLEEERVKRKKYQSFFGSIQLRVGDVVKVPTHVPHSLRHGVRTVEFQTPVYERLILAFAQKVLTQDRWDTEMALDRMKHDDMAKTDLESIGDFNGVLFEKVVRFSDFEVLRFKANRTSNFSFEDEPLSLKKKYVLIFSLSEGVHIKQNQSTSTLAPEQCVLISASSLHACVELEAQSQGLIAYPV